MSWPSVCRGGGGGSCLGPRWPGAGRARSHQSLVYHNLPGKPDTQWVRTKIVLTGRELRVLRAREVTRGADASRAGTPPPSGARPARKMLPRAQPGGLGQRAPAQRLGGSPLQALQAPPP